MAGSKDIRITLGKAGLMPQEEMLEVAKKKGALYIGIPRETSFQENRVSLVPDGVGLLVNNGHRIIVETDAGKMANFSDNEYSEAGAEISPSAKEVYKADIIIKMAPPSLNEIALMKPGQTLLSALQLTVQPKDFVQQLIAKKITAIAYDWIKDDDGIYPVIRAMSEIAGSTSILIAAEYLSTVHNGQGSILGGITGISPTEVVIIGAGAVGEFAARAALGLGASVKVFDNSLHRLRRFQSIVGTRVFTSVIHPKVLAKHLKTADVVIGAIRPTRGRSPIIVTEEMVKEMKQGAVIVDVCIDQGGCVETSEITNHTQPIFRKHGVTHYCVPNIASRVSRTASFALSTIFAPVLLNMGEEGSVDALLKKDLGVRNGVYIYHGILTNRILGEIFKLPYKEIDLLMAAF
jgi:alanine dehydrogenase